MPAYHLPIFPSGTVHINSTICFEKRDGYVTYFNYMMPIFRHKEDDSKSFRMMVSQLCVLGLCSQSDIINKFGVTKQTVYRDVALYRKEGVAGFFKVIKRGGPTVIIPEVKLEAEKLLSEGFSINDVAEELGISFETLRKAVYRKTVYYKKDKKILHTCKEAKKKDLSLKNQ